MSQSQEPWCAARSCSPASPLNAADAAARTNVDRVLIVSLPHLSWSDLDGRDDVPNITRLLDESAVADLSVRAPSIRPDLAGGYATLERGRQGRRIGYR